MDALLLFTQDRTSHKNKLEAILKALLKNGLKILQMCQLFKNELKYTGNTIFIKGKKVCVKCMKRRIQAIKGYEAPTIPGGCISLCKDTCMGLQMDV